MGRRCHYVDNGRPPHSYSCLARSLPCTRHVTITTLQNRSAEEFKKVLTAADAPAAMKLLLHDAGTYDRATGNGGCDGSIVLFP